MTPDICLVIGLVLAAFALPSALSALIDQRRPRVSLGVVLISGALILYGLYTQPGGYTLADIPNAFVRVAALILR